VRYLPRTWLIASFAGCMLFAAGFALFTSDPLHRFWGISAAIAYLVAALAVMAWRSRVGVDAALAVIFCGAVVVPLIWLAWHGQAQPEVAVVARSAKTLIKNGTPYESPKVLATTTNPNAYNPYLPLMSAFGVPQAIFGHSIITDPRVWFGVVYVLVFAFALRVGGAKDYWRWALLVTASPVIALELAVGGTDVPMVAFLCLGFAYLYRNDGELYAGVALGIASSMKATAWPALAVALTLLLVRNGKREAWRFILMALAVVVVCVGPTAVTRPGSLVKNTILFPLGLASVKSQAASPLIGNLIAGTGHIGHSIVVGLLVASAIAIGVSLIIAPPQDVPAAVIRLVIALSLMFVLAPSTRFGYFIYPGGMMLWLLACSAGRYVSPGPRSQPAILQTID
jgi:hypothetical protein